MNARRTPGAEPELEHAAAGLFRSLASDEMDPGVSASIHGDMASALANGATPARHRTRFAFGGFAMLAPLLAVGAVGAASGSPIVSGPVEMVSSVAGSIGIGGNSGDVRSDMESRAEASGDVGQPASTPGNTANAPGLAKVNGASNSSETSEATEPTEPTEGGDASDSAEKTNPHENGKGCDDVLFAAGEPPFATSGGPVGCDVGSSGDHRKNGTKQDSDTGETPSATADEDTTDDSEDGDSQGGASKGLGHGHDEDPPGNGNGNGHDVHEHEPNENGNGPSKEPPGQSDTGSNGNGGANKKDGGQADQGGTAPGNSGNAPGKNKK